MTVVKRKIVYEKCQEDFDLGENRQLLYNMKISRRFQFRKKIDELNIEISCKFRFWEKIAMKNRFLNL